MGMPAKTAVEMVDFPGLMSISPTDMPPGAAEVQVNICSVKVGELQVRGGMREVTFDVE